MKKQLSLTTAQKSEMSNLFSDALENRAGHLQMLNVSPEYFKQLLLNALVRTPALANCTKYSLCAAIYRSVELGMVPDGKHGAIVPLKNKADFWPMIDGILLKVRQAIPNISIHADAAFETDEWDDLRGSSAKLIHRPNPKAVRSESNLLAVYAVAHMPNNDVPEYEIMYRDEAATFKRNIPGPWQTHPIQMYKIRVLKRLVNRLPINLTLMHELSKDASEEGIVIDEENIIEGDAVQSEPVQEAEPPKKKAPPKKAKPEPAPKPEPEPEPEPEPVQAEPEDDEDDLTADFADDMPF